MLTNEKTSPPPPSGDKDGGTLYSRVLVGLAALFLGLVTVSASSMYTSNLHLMQTRIKILEEENQLQERAMELIREDLARLEKGLMSVNDKSSGAYSPSQQTIAREEMNQLKLEIDAETSRLTSTVAQLKALGATNCSQPCMGLTDPEDWKKWYKTGIYIDVDTSDCDFPTGSKPMYFTSVSGSTDILANDFGGTIFRSQHNSFRTVLHNAIDYNKKVTPDDAMDGEFRVQWVAFLPPDTGTPLKAMQVTSEQE